MMSGPVAPRTSLLPITIAAIAGAACGLSAAGAPPSADTTSEEVDGGRPNRDGGPREDGSDPPSSFTLNVNVVPGTASTATVSSGDGGIACPPSCSIEVEEGATVTLQVAHGPDDLLVSWQGDGCAGPEPTCTITMDAPRTITATFSALTIFVHSALALYALDGPTGATTMRGFFSCIDAMGDIALSRSGALYGITLPAGTGTSELFTIDRTDATCSAPIGDLGRRCNGLTFAPDPTNPAQEVLLASCAGDLVRVNPATGAITVIGAFGQGLAAAGDVVYLPGAGLFVTLAPNAGNNRIALVNPTTGAATLRPGDLGPGGFFGLAYRAGALLGFANDTDSIAIDPTTGGVTDRPSTGIIAYGATAGP